MATKTTTTTAIIASSQEPTEQPTLLSVMGGMNETEARALRRAGWRLLHKVNVFYDAHAAELSPAQEEAVWDATNALDDALTIARDAHPTPSRPDNDLHNPAAFARALRDLRVAMERLAPLDALTAEARQ